MATGSLLKLTQNSISTGIGYAAGGAISPAMAPLTQAILNKVWPQSPNVPIPPADLAAMAVQGVMSETDAAAEAVISGINHERFHRLFRVNGNPIAPEEALDLWDRGEISEADVDRALLQSRLKPEWVDTFKKLSRRILQADALAEMVVQSIMPESEATAGARKLGIEDADFHKMVRLAGNPPGPQDSLTLWNRGIFTESDATLALRQSRLKPEWIEQFKRSRIRPATTAQAAEAVVKERIPFEAGVRIAHENGTDPDTFRLMVNTGGRPIGIQQSLALLNRGVYTSKDVREVVARSDVKTEYTDAILHLAVRYPSILQVRQLVERGAIDDEYALRLLTDQGFPVELAQGVVAAAHNDKTSTERDLSKSEVVTLYQGGGLSFEDAAGMLQALGWDEREASFILTMADFRRIARALELVINRVHSQYVSHRIGVDVVTTELDAVGVPTGQREQLLDLWTEERKANVRVLTEAQIVKAVHKTLRTPEWGTARLLQLGYDEDSAGLLLSL